MDKLIGREVEKKLLDEAMQSGNAELIALFGRRRVGKTFLIRQYLKKNLALDFVGTRDAKLPDQLSNFSKALGKAVGNDTLYRQPDSWSNAFDQLSHFLGTRLEKGRAVVFLDEFPWLNSHKSGFLAAFDHWWNSWGSNQPNLAVVICGSAASWMIEHVVNSKGGLHNRITRKIRLLPFNLQETAAFLQAGRVNLDHYQLLQLYMVMGGVPHYLKEVRKGESAVQAIDRICFTKDGLLHNEFKNLYHSLFDDPVRHLSVVKALAVNNTGLSRNEIIQKTGLSSGGTISALLEELMESGFVMAAQPYDKKSRDAVYKLADEFTHFYFKFIEKGRSQGAGSWQSFAAGQSWKSWSGVAFERTCLKHVPQIKKALGISGVYTEEAAWRFQPAKGKGAQVDLLIDRNDFVINLCEMKYSVREFIIDKGYAAELENKISAFTEQTKTRKSIFLTMVTSFGINDNEYSRRLVQNQITMDALFS